MLNQMRIEFAHRVKRHFKNIQFKLDQVTGQKVISALTNNDDDFREKDRIRVKEEYANSNLMLINYFIDELIGINRIETNIPNEIKALLSPYGTFYDGYGILYCDKDLSTTELLFCTLNHISHYTAGMYYYKTTYPRQEVMRYFAALDILDVTTEWDLAGVYTKYFDKIFRDEFKDVIIFEPARTYKKWMMERIEKNEFNQAVYFDYNNIKYLCTITRELGPSGVTHNINCCPLSRPGKNGSKTMDELFFNRKVRKDTVVEQSYGRIIEPIRKLLINNNFKIVSDGED